MNRIGYGLVFSLTSITFAGCGSSPAGIGASPADQALQAWFDESVALEKAEKSGNKAELARLEQNMVNVGMRVYEELKKLPENEREALLDRWAPKFENAGFAPPGGFNQ